MTDDNRKKKKRGRSKIILRSCFRSTTGDGPSSSLPPDKSDANRNDEKLADGRLGRDDGRDFASEVDLVNGCDNDNDDDDDDCCTKRSSSSRRRISRILKAVLFNAKLKKKNRTSSSKSSMSSDTSSSSLSNEKLDKSSFNDCNGNAYARECPDMDDSVSYSRRSNLFSSSSRTTSSAYSTSSRTTSSAYSTSSLSSGSTSNQKPSSLIENILEFGYHPVSSNSSASKKSNPTNNNSNYNSSSCFDQKISSSKSTTPMNSISPSVSHQKGLSRLNSTDSTTSVSSNVFLLMNSNPDKLMFGGNSWNIRWCLFLLLSLVVLMIWGRIFSIMCTSIWFYFVPCRRIKRVDSATSIAEFVDTDSKHYKKRVIMAGLLDRTRNPIR